MGVGRLRPTQVYGATIEEGGIAEHGRDFIQALARGLDVLRCFGPDRTVMSLSDVARATDLARPTARRILLTLEELGYVLEDDGTYALTPRVLELGMAYVQSQGVWAVARPHMEALVARTGESTSLAQLDGSDIVYVARVAVPKIIALAVTIGTRFPALPTSLGKVLLAELGPAELDARLAEPTRSGLVPVWQPDRAERDAELRQVRAQGYAVADEVLASGIRSTAVPLRDGSGRVVASMNVTTHAAETSLDVLLREHLPLLREAAAAVSADLARRDDVPLVTVGRTPG